MSAVNEIINRLKTDLSIKYVGEIQDSYKNYKNSPVGKMVIKEVRTGLDIKHTLVYKLNGSLVTKSNKIYNELVNGGAKFNKVSERYLRAEVLRDNRYFIQTLKRAKTGYAVLREFEKDDGIPAYTLRCYEPGLEYTKEEGDRLAEHVKKFSGPARARKTGKFSAGATEAEIIASADVEDVLFDR
jgi:hypothetical protein